MTSQSAVLCDTKTAASATVNDSLPTKLFKSAVDHALRGDMRGVLEMCQWFNRRHGVSMAAAGSVHLWVLDKHDASRIWIAHAHDEIEHDDIALLIQPTWLDAVVKIGERIYAVFIAEQTSFDANPNGFVELSLVNGPLYESYDIFPWDDRIVATREFAAFVHCFSDVWQEIVEAAQKEAN